MCCPFSQNHISLVMAGLIYLLVHGIRFSFPAYMLRMYFDLRKGQFEAPQEYTDTWIDEKKPTLVTWWLNPVRATILMAYFIGLLCGQLPFTCLMQRVGARVPVSLALIGAGVANIFLGSSEMTRDVLLREANFRAIGIRFVVGLCFSCVMPGLQQLLHMWVILKHRLGVQVVLSNCSYLGAIIGIALASFFPQQWKLFNLIGGGSCIIMGIMFFLLVRNRYEYYPGIELEVLRIKRTGGAARMYPQTPWKQMLLSCQVWSILFTQFSSSMVTHYFETLIPFMVLARALDSVLMEEGDACDRQYILGLFHSLVFVMSWLGTNCAYIIEDKWRHSRYCPKLTTFWMRRLMNSLATIPSAILMLATLWSQKFYVFFAISCIVMFFKGLATGGFKVNMYDITEYFYEQLIQMAHFCGNVAAVFILVLYACCVEFEWPAYNFQLIGGLAASFLMLSGLFFFWKCKVEVQSWDEIPR